MLHCHWTSSKRSIQTYFFIYCHLTIRWNIWLVRQLNVSLIKYLQNADKSALAMTKASIVHQCCSTRHIFKRGQWRVAEKNIVDFPNSNEQKWYITHLVCCYWSGVLPGKENINKRVNVSSHFWTASCLDKNKFQYFTMIYWCQQEASLSFIFMLLSLHHLQ